MSFTHPLQIFPDDIDLMGHVNNVVYVRWVQDVAEAHWNHIAPPEVKARYLWVVLRHEIEYKNPALLADSIAGITWVGEHNGARFDRVVNLFSPITQKCTHRPKQRGASSTPTRSAQPGFPRKSSTYSDSRGQGYTALKIPKIAPIFAGGMETEYEKITRKIRKDAWQLNKDFGLVEEGDLVMVCLSGGKDSYTMLDAYA